MKILGLDPSLRNFAIVKGDLNLNTLEFSPESRVLIETEKNKRAKSVASDDYERALTIANAVKQELTDAKMVFAEVPTGSQSARAGTSYGICVATIAMIDKPVIRVTPTEVKMNAVGDKEATKEEMIEWAYNLYPEFDWMTRGKTKKLLAKNEHLADAIAAIHAGLRSEQFLSVRAIANHL